MVVDRFLLAAYRRRYVTEVADAAESRTMLRAIRDTALENLNAGMLTTSMSVEGQSMSATPIAGDPSKMIAVIAEMLLAELDGETSAPNGRIYNFSTRRVRT